MNLSSICSKLLGANLLTSSEWRYLAFSTITTLEAFLIFQQHYRIILRQFLEVIQGALRVNGREKHSQFKPKQLIFSQSLDLWPKSSVIESLAFSTQSESKHLEVEALSIEI